MTSAEIKIRYANSSDNVLLAEFGARAFYDSFAADNTPEHMAAYLGASFGPGVQATELADLTSVFLIAEVEDVMVGYARLKESPPPPEVTGKRPIELVRIYSSMEWIGRGIGSALMKACLREAERLECDIIWLGVWERNTRAQAFYRKWGFVEVGTQLFQLGDDLQTDLVMQRQIK